MSKFDGLVLDESDIVERLFVQHIVKDILESFVVMEDRGEKLLS